MQEAPEPTQTETGKTDITDPRLSVIGKLALAHVMRSPEFADVVRPQTEFFLASLQRDLDRLQAMLAKEQEAE